MTVAIVPSFQQKPPQKKNGQDRDHPDVPGGRPNSEAAIESTAERGDWSPNGTNTGRG